MRTRARRQCTNTDQHNGSMSNHDCRSTGGLRGTRSAGCAGTPQSIWLRRTVGDATHKETPGRCTCGWYTVDGQPASCPRCSNLAGWTSSREGGRAWCHTARPVDTAPSMCNGVDQDWVLWEMEKNEKERERERASDSGTRVVTPLTLGCLLAKQVVIFKLPDISHCPVDVAVDIFPHYAECPCPC